MTVWSAAPSDLDPRGLELLERGAQVVVGVTDLQAEVVHPDTPARAGSGLRPVPPR